MSGMKFIVIGVEVKTLGCVVKFDLYIQLWIKEQSKTQHYKQQKRPHAGIGQSQRAMEC